MDMSKTYSTLKLTSPTPKILQITLNRPDSLNALNNVLLNELQEVVNAIATDDDVTGVLLTGEGKAFCAGADIKQLLDLNGQTGTQFAESGQAVFSHLENLSKPCVAAINGVALGGGCELAMATTLRIASENAKFGQPEIKLGLLPGYGGTQRLPRLIGKGRALDLCLTGRLISADEALQWGLVNYVAAANDLINTSIELLKVITSMGSQAIGSIIELVNHGFDIHIDQALKLEALHFGKLCTTNDKTEGVNAFLQKRTAKFHGD